MTNLNNYSFCKFKIPSQGGRVIWEITNECNYACSYCIFSSTGKKPEGELDIKKVLSTIDELKNSGFNYIKITGGEPFLRSDMLDILSYIKKSGFEVDISTNASKITKEIAKELSNLKLNYIHVSIDGYNQHTHESVRGKKSFEPTIQGLQLLKEFDNTIRIGTVLHRNNENHIKSMIDFYDTFHVQQIAFSLMEPVGRLKNKKDLLAISSSDALARKIDKLKSIYSYSHVSHNLSSVSPIVFNSIKNADNETLIPCPGGDKFLFINSIGIVSPCPWVSDVKSAYHSESLHEESLSTILTSPSFSKFNHIKNVFAQQFSPISICPMEKLEEFNNIEIK